MPFGLCLPSASVETWRDELPDRNRVTASTCVKRRPLCSADHRQCWRCQCVRVVLRSERVAVRAVSRTSDLHAGANTVPPRRVWARAAGTTPREMVSMRACVGCAAVLIEAKAQVAPLGHLERDLRWSPGVFDCWRGCQTRVELARCRATRLQARFEEAFAVFLLEQHSKVIRGWLKVDWATELRRVSEDAQAAADRGELRLVYQSP